MRRSPSSSSSPQSPPPLPPSTIPLEYNYQLNRMAPTSPSNSNNNNSGNILLDNQYTSLFGDPVPPVRDEFLENLDRNLYGSLRRSSIVNDFPKYNSFSTNRDKVSEEDGSVIERLRSPTKDSARNRSPILDISFRTLSASVENNNNNNSNINISNSSRIQSPLVLPLEPHSRQNLISNEQQHQQLQQQRHHLNPEIRILPGSESASSERLHSGSIISKDARPDSREQLDVDSDTIYPQHSYSSNYNWTGMQRNSSELSESFDNGEEQIELENRPDRVYSSEPRYVRQMSNESYSSTDWFKPSNDYQEWTRIPRLRPSSKNIMLINQPSNLNKESSVATLINDSIASSGSEDKMLPSSERRRILEKPPIAARPKTAAVRKLESEINSSFEETESQPQPAKIPRPESVLSVKTDISPVIVTNSITTGADFRISTSRLHKKSSFSILAEKSPQSSRAQSPNHVISGRSTPFLGRGFKEPVPRPSSQPVISYTSPTKLRLPSISNNFNTSDESARPSVQFNISSISRRGSQLRSAPLKSISGKRKQTELVPLNNLSENKKIKSFEALPRISGSALPVRRPPPRRLNKSALDLYSNKERETPKPYINPNPTSKQRGVLRIFSVSADNSPSKIPIRANSFSVSMDDLSLQHDTHLSVPKAIRRKSSTTSTERRSSTQTDGHPNSTISERRSSNLSTVTTSDFSFRGGPTSFSNTAQSRRQSIFQSGMLLPGASSSSSSAHLRNRNSSSARSPRRVAKPTSLSPIIGTPNREGSAEDADSYILDETQSNGEISSPSKIPVREGSNLPSKPVSKVTSKVNSSSNSQSNSRAPSRSNSRAPSRSNSRAPSRSNSREPSRSNSRAPSVANSRSNSPAKNRSTRNQNTTVKRSSEVFPRTTSRPTSRASSRPDSRIPSRSNSRSTSRPNQRETVAALRGSQLSPRRSRRNSPSKSSSSSPNKNRSATRNQSKSPNRSRSSVRNSNKSVGGRNIPSSSKSPSVRRNSPKRSSVRGEPASAKKTSSSVRRIDTSTRRTPSNTKKETTLKREPSNLKRSTSNLKREPLKREPSSLKRTSSNLKREPSNLRCETSNLKRETSNLKRETSNLRREPSNLKREPSNLKRESSNLKKDATGLKRETSNLKKTSSFRREASNNKIEANASNANGAGGKLKKEPSQTKLKRQPSNLMKRRTDSNLSKKLEKKSSFKNEKTNEGSTSGQEEIQNESKPQEDTTTNSDSTGKLVPLTKANVVSMTTAAITAQPVQITTALTNQIPSSKTNSSGQLISNSDKPLGEENPENLPAAILEKSTRTLESIQKTVTEATEEIHKTINENLTDLKSLENDMGASVPPFEKSDSRRTLGGDNSALNVTRTIATGVPTSGNNQNTNQASSISPLPTSTQPIEANVSVLSSKKSSDNLLLNNPTNTNHNNNNISSKENSGMDDMTERVSERAISVLPEVDCESGNFQSHEQNILDANPDVGVVASSKRQDDGTNLPNPAGGDHQMSGNNGKDAGKDMKQGSGSQEYLNQDENPPTGCCGRSSRACRFCSRICMPCRRCQCCKCGRGTPSSEAEKTVMSEENEKVSCWKRMKCCKSKSKIEKSKMETMSEKPDNEANQEQNKCRLCLSKFFCCKKTNKVESIRMGPDDEYEIRKCCFCIPCRRKKKPATAWREQRTESIMSEPPSSGGKCSRIIEKLKCWKKKPVISESRRTSLNSKKQSIAPTLPPEDRRPKLHIDLVEYNSKMKGAIPVLPLILAWFCFICNIIVPGLGTLFSGFFCLCIGIPRFSQFDSAKARIGSFIINCIVCASQLFCVLFCLVGWGWSIWWGIIMIRMARKLRKIKRVERLEMEEEQRQAANAALQGDVEAGRT